jgi:hypothetical protein
VTRPGAGWPRNLGSNPGRTCFSVLQTGSGTTHSVTRIRICGAIPLPLHASSSHSVQLSRRTTLSGFVRFVLYANVIWERTSKCLILN